MLENYQQKILCECIIVKGCYRVCYQPTEMIGCFLKVKPFIEGPAMARWIFDKAAIPVKFHHSQLRFNIKDGSLITVLEILKDNMLKVDIIDELENNKHNQWLSEYNIENFPSRVTWHKSSVTI